LAVLHNVVKPTKISKQGGKYYNPPSFSVEFLSKPVAAEELLRAVDAAIALDRTARQKRSELAEYRHAITA